MTPVFLRHISRHRHCCPYFLHFVCTSFIRPVVLFTCCNLTHFYPKSNPRDRNRVTSEHTCTGSSRSAEKRKRQAWKKTRKGGGIKTPYFLNSEITLNNIIPRVSGLQPDNATIALASLRTWGLEIWLLL